MAWKIRQNGGRREEDFEVKHIFEPGLYIREFELPADFIFIGRVHKVGHLVELIKGSTKLITGQGTVVYHAVDRLVTAPGFQTVIHTLTAILACSVHPNPNELRDTEELEDLFFEPVQPLLAKGQGIQERLWLA